jgi:hypothetical protein
VSDLKPWEGPDDAASEEEGSSGYLLMAGIGCGLIIAIGAHALVGHFAERPELAQADPLMVKVISVARATGAGLAIGSLAGWLAKLARSSKKP